MSAHLSPDEVETAATGGELPAHAQSCAECRTAVVRARGRQTILKGLTPYTLSDAAFARVEAKALAEAQQPAPSRVWFWVPRLLPVAAVLALGAFLMFRTSAPTPTPVVLPQPVPAPVEAVAVVKTPVYQPLTVAMVRGRATQQPLSAPEADELGVGFRLPAGTLVQTVSDEGAVVAVNDADQVRAELRGQVRVGELGASLLLFEKAVASLEVQKDNGYWLVRAGETWVGAVDADFSVTRVAADQVVLEVTRGSVSYGEWARRDAPGTEVAAGIKLTLGPAGAVTRATVVSASRFPVWRLGVPVSVGVSATEVELDGQKYGGAPLALLMPAGKHTLRTWKADGSSSDLDFDLREGHPFSLSAGPKPHVEVEVDTAALSAWVSAQKRKLSPCYEKWLKAQPDARGSAVLTMSVSANGRVTSSRVEPDEVLPKAVVECLSATVKKWQPPVRDTDVEIPLVFGGP